jgi:hypothetical protein
LNTVIVLSGGESDAGGGARREGETLTKDENSARVNRSGLATAYCDNRVRIGRRKRGRESYLDEHHIDHSLREILEVLFEKRR